MPRSIKEFKGKCLLVAGGWGEAHTKNRTARGHIITPDEFYLVSLNVYHLPDMAMDFTNPYVVDQFEGKKFDFIYFEGITHINDVDAFIQLFKNAAGLLSENGIMFYTGGGGGFTSSGYLTTDAMVLAGFEGIKNGIEKNDLRTVDGETKPLREHTRFRGSYLLASKKNQIINEEIIDTLPEQAQKIITTQVDTKNLFFELSTETLQESIDNYINYKNNRYFGLSWLKSSDESYQAALDMKNAANDSERHKIAKKYVDKSPDKAFANELKKVCRTLRS